MYDVNKIENKRFSQKIRGYDTDEVDGFLDEIVLAIKKYDEKIAVLSKEIEEFKFGNTMGIEVKTFSEAYKGYDKDDVNEFLKKLMIEISICNEGITCLRKEVDEIKHRV